MMYPNDSPFQIVQLLSCSPSKIRKSTGDLWKVFLTGEKMRNISRNSVLLSPRKSVCTLRLYIFLKRMHIKHFPIIDF